jgi:hypothetical protein
MLATMTLLMLMGQMTYLSDAYVICGQEPLQECLVQADACLRAEQDAGTDVDLAFDICADEVEHLVKIKMPVWPGVTK